MLKEIDWAEAAKELEVHGCALLPRLLDREACDAMTAGWDDRERFRSEVMMGRHGYGRGAYRYFAYPLPNLVAELRAELYPPLAAIANRWAEVLEGGTRYPPAHGDFLARCQEAGQLRPTPLLLRYETGDWNALHQDVYGETLFPLQVAILLSEPGEDFTGGEFVLTEQRPRMQSRAEVVPLRRGDAVVFRCGSGRFGAAGAGTAGRCATASAGFALAFASRSGSSSTTRSEAGCAGGAGPLRARITRRPAMSKRAFSLILLLAAAACARSEDAAVVADQNEVQAVERVRTPEQDDDAIALGEWRQTLQEEEGALEFGPAGAPPIFSLRCDERRTVYLQRHGTPSAGDLPMMLLTIGSETRRLAVTSVSGPVPMLRASIPPSDSLIATLGGATTPIVVRVGDTAPLGLPPSPAVGSFLTQCGSGARREPGETPQDANQAAPTNEAAPAANASTPAARR